MTRPDFFAPLLARVAERRTSEPTSSTDGLPARDERAAHWRGPRGVSHVVKRSATALALSASLLGVVGLSPSPAAQAQSTPPSAPAVSKPVVNILCKFQGTTDTDTQGKTADDVQAMFTGSGGLNDYFQEQSNGAINLAGTITKGWYPLPGTKASYLPGDNIYTGHPGLARDCTAAAKDDVNFPSFSIINLWFSDPELGSMGFTNGSLRQTLNG